MAAARQRTPIISGMLMNSTADSLLAHLRLTQLISPSLPVGAFTYSQGLEWAVEVGWVKREGELYGWVKDLLLTNMAHLEIPLLGRLYKACGDEDMATLSHWSQYLISCRETRELRQEEQNRGRALTALLPELGIDVPGDRLPLLRTCQLTGFAHAAHCWDIPLQSAAAGYLWGWLENITLAGVKIIPLGQTAGQRIIASLTGLIPEIVHTGLSVPDDKIGASCPAQAIASSLHENQYTRLYRS